ncbi:hypothetical protein Sjap_017875 [Stephania japonica]|uniref:Protein TIC 40, chloroplastic n=1 Tax=Stephania japonica TaxID=461633 RepID=A0AAP0I730_9MAGN
MENLALISSPKVLTPSCASLSSFVSTRRPFLPLTPQSLRRRRYAVAAPTRALSQGNSDGAHRAPRKNSFNVMDKSGLVALASISSSSSNETSSIGINPQNFVPPPSSQVGSPLFWIGVGVGLSALFSWVAANLKKYAMQQALKTMMGQMSPESSKFNSAAFSPRSPFPFPASGPLSPVVSPSPSPPQSAVTVDVPVTKVEAAPASEVGSTEIKDEPKSYAFVDVSPEEMSEKDGFEDPIESTETSSPKNPRMAEKVYQNGAASKQNTGVHDDQSQFAQKAGSVLSVEALEKMMEDPTVQKMVYPYLPEEMRNPTTFKWMLQNPQYRQQLQDMLNNMGGSNDWDNRMTDSLKNFDLSSPEVKQQFDQIGLTPEEVISKIMANPDVAMAFQNPRVQAAIMDCSQNPLSIAKYQNDKETFAVCF